MYVGHVYVGHPADLFPAVVCDIFPLASFLKQLFKCP